MEVRPLLHLTSGISSLSGGIGEAIVQMCVGLRKGTIYHPTVLSYEVPGFHEPRLSQANVEHVVLQIRGPYNLQYAPAMPNKLRQLRPIIVHQHGLWQYNSFIIGKLRRQIGFKYVLSPHGMLDPWAVKHQGWKKRIATWLFERRNLQTADCVHALCAPESDAIRDFQIRSPIAQIPNAINLPKDVLRSRPAILSVVPNDCKTLLFLGRLHPKKGIDLLIQAFSKDLPVDWHLCIAGWGDADYQKQLELLATQSPASGRIHFLGSVFGDDKDALYQHSSAFILPSHSEGLPMAVLEAWAHRLPTLITKQCNLPEAVHKESTLVIEPNVESVRNGLQTLMQLSDSARKRIGDEGRKLVETKFTWDIVSKQFAEVYDWIQNKSEKPSFVYTTD